MQLKRLILVLSFLVRLGIKSLIGSSQPAEICLEAAILGIDGAKFDATHCGVYLQVVHSPTNETAILHLTLRSLSQNNFIVNRDVSDNCKSAYRAT